MKWRVVAAVLVVAVVGWSGWWVLGSNLKTAALEGWLAERRAAGWVAEAASITTSGFPNRFDTRIEGLELVDPERGWGYATPFADILMLAYQPNAAIVALPSGQQISIPGATVTVLADTLRGSIRFVPGPSLELAALSVEGEALVLQPDGAQDESGRIRLAALHLRPLDAGAAPDNGYAVYAELDQLDLTRPLRRLLDPVGALPPRVERVIVDGRVAFDAPLDRRAVEDRLPGISALSLTRATLNWGSVVLSLSGSLEADAAGFATGTLDLEAEQWRALLSTLISNGTIGRDVASALEFGLGLFARERNGRSVLSVPLNLGSGVMRLGPIPIGRAPRLRNP